MFKQILPLLIIVTLFSCDHQINDSEDKKTTPAFIPEIGDIVPGVRSVTPKLSNGMTDIFVPVIRTFKPNSSEMGAGDSFTANWAGLELLFKITSEDSVFRYRSEVDNSYSILIEYDSESSTFTYEHIFNVKEMDDKTGNIHNMILVSTIPTTTVDENGYFHGMGTLAAYSLEFNSIYFTSKVEMYYGKLLKNNLYLYDHDSDPSTPEINYFNENITGYGFAYYNIGLKGVSENYSLTITEDSLILPILKNYISTPSTFIADQTLNQATVGFIPSVGKGTLETCANRGEGNIAIWEEKHGIENADLTLDKFIPFIPWNTKL